MKIVVIGLSHKTAHLHVRERVSFSEVNIRNSYMLLKTYSEIKESFILSTCNRVETYGVGYDAKTIEEALKDFLYKSHGIAPGSLEEYLYHKSDDEAVRHLLRIAAGLDSMVIGENQILGQIKRSYKNAEDAGSVGFYLHRWLQEALCMGKKVRSETQISQGVTSIPGAALELIKRERNIAAKRVLVIGAGKIGGMTVNKLMALNVKEVAVINRDLLRAAKLANHEKVRVHKLGNLHQEIARADIVISALSTIRPIISQTTVQQALKGRQERQLLLIDMGVPRNIEESIREIDGVSLYNVDDLSPITEETMQRRSAEAEKAEEMIQDKLCEKSFSE